MALRERAATALEGDRDGLAGSFAARPMRLADAHRMRVRGGREGAQEARAAGATLGGAERADFTPRGVDFTLARVNFEGKLEFWDKFGPAATPGLVRR